MKRTLSLFLAVVLAFSVSVCGAQMVCAAENSVPEIAIESNENSIISVSGKTDANARITLLILNPGATEAGLAESAGQSTELADKVQYMDVIWPDGNGDYKFTVNMNDTCDGGGLFKVIVTIGDEKLTPIDYYFYFYEAKLKVLDALNGQPCAEIPQTVKEAYVKMGLSDFDLYKNGNISDICDAIDFLKDAEESGKLERDLDAFYDALKDAAYIAAFNAHNEALLIKNNKLAYGEELLGLKDTQLWTDYSSINSEGISLFHKELLGGSYKAIKDICDKFEELVAFYGVEYYNKAGFGHLDAFFKNYEAVYEKYGFELDEINSDNRNYVYSNLMSEKADDLSDLADRFNDLIDDAEGDDSGSGSSSHRGGNSGGGGSISAPTTPTDSYIVPEDKFTDLAGYSWAEKEIEELRDKGIINGRTAEIFAPADYVTRAEFLKMLVSVYDLKAASNECKFEDVGNDWSRPYIIAALEAEIANGITDTLFDPNGRVTREMSTVFAVRAMNYAGHTLESDDNAFADDGSISDWAKDSVYKLKNAGVVSGIGENLFNPQGCLTRAEAAKIIHGIMLYN